MASSGHAVAQSATLQQWPANTAQQADSNSWVYYPQASAKTPLAVGGAKAEIPALTSLHDLLQGRFIPSLCALER